MILVNLVFSKESRYSVFMTLFQLESSWQGVLEQELRKPYIHDLAKFLDQEQQLKKEVYPPPQEIFRAFTMTPYHDVKVVVVGQDPYHGPGQAHGLCFSVARGTKLPPSLQNIYKELEADLGVPRALGGDLSSWARQGVFLLNATLTVRRGEPLSHQKRGWEPFTDAVLRCLADREEPIIFVLWGKHAQKKIKQLEHQGFLERHVLLKAAHPSPLSVYRGFFGSKPFSKINNQLKVWGLGEIDWRVH